MANLTRRIGAFAVGWFSLVICCAEVPAQSWAEKMFATTTHDFHSVGRGATAEHRFEFRNLYEEEVHVAAVRSSCGCTTPTLTKDTLRTHERAAVVAKLNTRSFVGSKSATITVVFDKPYYAEVRLRVSGHIRTDISFDPPEIAFDDTAPGQAREQEVTITHRGRSSWRITDVRSHCQHMQVKLDSPETTPATGVAPATVTYRMRVRLLGSMPEGDIWERLTLVSNDASFPTTEMSVSGRVRPSLAVAPAALSLGRLPVGASSEERLVVRGEAPFEIREVICADDRFSFDVAEGSKKLHFVKIKFHAEDDRPVSHRIRIVTDLDDGKSASFVVTGSVLPSAE